MNSGPVPILIPPHSLESERILLGCMLTSVGSLNIAADLLSKEDFYTKAHQDIFEVLKRAFSRDAPMDVHLAAQELKRLKLLKECGGVAYLTELAQYAGTSAHIHGYAGVIKNKAMLRRMIEAAKQVQQQAASEPDNVDQALDEAQNLFFSISQSKQNRFGIELKEVFDGRYHEEQMPFLKELELRQERYHTLGPQEIAVTGLTSHFIDLDKLTHGLGPSHLIILAARPAMGKTGLALNLAENICFKSGKAVGFFSLEMTADQLAHRIICSQSEVESEKIKSGSLSGPEYQNVVAAVHRMSEHKMIIDDQPGLSIGDLRARARRMVESYGVEIIFIDYLQLLMGSSMRSNESRQVEISEISRMLKVLARELNIPVVCLSQLSRKVEERHNHRPMLSDLRESGSIEQDADIVMFLLRRDYYDPLDKPGMAELIIAKNRHGPVGLVPLTLRKEISQFANFTPDKQMNEAISEEFAQFSPT